MTEFDPDRPAKVHDRLNNRTFTWRASLGERITVSRPRSDKVEGTVRWDGLVLDGWKPIARSH